MRDAIFFALIVLAGTGGELCISRAMKSVGEAKSLHPAEIVRIALRAICQPWMWLGVAQMATGFFALLGALSAMPVSFVVPVTALSYLFGALGSASFLKEKITPQRWLGLGIVTLGVVLVMMSKLP